MLVSCLGLVFLRAGYRHSPWGGESDGAEFDGPVTLSAIDDAVVSRSRPPRRPSGRTGERDDDR